MRFRVLLALLSLKKMRHLLLLVYPYIFGKGFISQFLLQEHYQVKVALE